MADYAPNVTPRLRVRYSSLGASHSFIWRASRSTTIPDELVAKATLFLGTLESTLYEDWSIIGCEWAQRDSDVFLPCIQPANPAGEVPVPAQTGQARTVSISYVGRSTTGAKARFFLYGTGVFPSISLATDQDFRIQAQEAVPMSESLAVLNSAEPTYLYAVDNSHVTWYQYANIKMNDHWVKRARRG